MTTHRNMHEVVQENKISTVNVSDKSEKTITKVSNTQQSKHCSVIAKSCQGSSESRDFSFFLPSLICFP